MIAVDKPPDMMVHRSLINPREKQVVMTLLRNQLGQWVYPVHRLDRPTTGVLLFALDKDTAKHLTESIEKRLVKKTYLAIVRGSISDSGFIDRPLKEATDRIADKNKNPEKPEQEAKTHFKSLATVEIKEPVSKYPTSRYSLVELQPETGRRHQLRRHLHHISHPVIGDTTYGDSKHNRFFRQRFICRGLLLSSVELKFKHPVHSKAVSISAPVGEDLQKIATEFSWNSFIVDRWKRF
ncbi:MAG: pseudouridine synthase [Proteobacteria bacterium]|nr:pseudouridine synthase [Pseudomonadota bacterium]